jgi:hypothetical protein
LQQQQHKSDSGKYKALVEIKIKKKKHYAEVSATRHIHFNKLIKTFSYSFIFQKLERTAYSRKYGTHATFTKKTNYIATINKSNPN